MPERVIYIAKFKGDGMAEGFEYQPEELGPHFQSWGSGSVDML